MTESKPEPPPNAPHGTHPRRGAGPLVLLVLANAAWLGVLIWLAVRYPAR